MTPELQRSTKHALQDTSWIDIGTTRGEGGGGLEGGYIYSHHYLYLKISSILIIIIKHSVVNEIYCFYTNKDEK